MTNHLMTIAQPASETSFTSAIPHAMGSIEHGTDIIHFNMKLPFLNASKYLKEMSHIYHF
jgi:hypothetical protein